jgi:hypothetical protein
MESVRTTFMLLMILLFGFISFDCAYTEESFPKLCQEL